ncbi:hypothetical protein [Streptomyces sp. NPDC047990]|uniref:hypothetical protein n=1 Tax=Streptomyces sp. NPDC047990 TaxID=3365496 RepID=UPI003720222E
MSMSKWKAGDRVLVGDHVKDAAGLTGTIQESPFEDTMEATSVLIDGDWGFPGIGAFFWDHELEALEPAEAGK